MAKPLQKDQSFRGRLFMAEQDVIIIGAGSIGVPTALAIAEKGYHVRVIERNTGPGMALNSKAIGGVRSTHSSQAKAMLCQESMQIFSTWCDRTGEEIGWYRGGYLFPSYTSKHTSTLMDIARELTLHGLSANWLNPDQMQKAFPWIITHHLEGGLHSPMDGRANPKLANAAFYKACLNLGVQFNFNEKVTAFKFNKGSIDCVVTSKGEYNTQFAIIAAGAFANEVGKMTGLSIPLKLEPHTAGNVSITPKENLDPLVIDLRPSEGTEMFYFFQNKEGNITFTIDPNKPIRDPTLLSHIIDQRLQLLFQNKVKGKILDYWSGVYPMTPDGTPIIGPVPNMKGLLVAVGMGGQGFMLGPGVGRLLARIIDDSITAGDKKILEELIITRKFAQKEKLK